MGAVQRPVSETIVRAIVSDPADDTYAWTGIHLDDGRTISIAWLRGWPGAVVGWWRR
jgi:hypothetical protein